MLVMDGHLRWGWVSVLIACGSRSGLPTEADPVRCQTLADCPGAADHCNPVSCAFAPNAGAEERGECQALAPVQCDDSDPCTTNACEPTTGGCVFDPVTPDLDADGHRAPLAGFSPGSAGACGDDCDDSTALAFPGGVEQCDGLDNDCDGTADDGAEYRVLSQHPIQLSAGSSPASPAGLSAGPAGFFAAYSGNAGGLGVFLRPFSLDGASVPETRLSLGTADGSGGDLLWLGDRFAVAWQDRRFGNYEVFLAFLDSHGAKLGADVQLSSSSGFSLEPTLGYRSGELIVAWQEDDAGFFVIRMGRLTLDGVWVAPPANLWCPTECESPVVAVGPNGYAVAYSQRIALDSGQLGVVVETFDFGGTQHARLVLDEAPSTAARHFEFPRLKALGAQGYVLGFAAREGDQQIYGALVSPLGELTVAPTPISVSTGQARFPALLPLGDRVLWIYGDTRDHNGGYELYAQQSDLALIPLGTPQRLTQAQGDSVSPIVGPGTGASGAGAAVLYRDVNAEGAQHVYALGLECVDAR